MLFVDFRRSFCDLSVREEEHDEWDTMGYSSKSNLERSQHALLRAGRIVRQKCTKITDNTKVLILSNEEDFVSQFPTEDGIQTLHIDDLVDFFIQQKLVSKTEYFLNLKARCEEDYMTRNTPPSEKENEKDP